MDELVIEGLSPLEQDIANRFWQMETQEEIDQFIESLPRSIKVKAIMVKELMIAACIDQAVREEPDLHLAADILRRYMRNPAC